MLRVSSNLGSFFLHLFPPLEQDVVEKVFDNPGDVSES